MTPEELEALRLAEEAEAQRLAQEEASTNPMMQPTDLIGQQGQQETVMDTDPLALAGLGGAAAFQGMFPFASEAAANSRGTTLPQLMGTGNSQFTGTNAGRLTQGTQIVPQTQLSTINQPPAVRSTGVPTTRGTNVTPSNASAARNIKMAERVRQLNLPNAAKLGRAGLNLSRLGSLLSPAALYTAADLGTEYFTGRGISERFGEFGGELLGEAIYGDGNLPAFSEEELAQIQQGSVASDTNQPQMSRLSDEPLVFNAPTGPSSTATQAAQIAETLPDDAGLMGAPGVQGTGIPTTTIDVDGGSATVPQALADQTFRGVGSAPMSIEETRARLGGRTLNEYLNAPNGTPGVSGLRTDPQGRMIPAGFETRADAYPSYEDFAAEREGRLAARMQQPGESITERDTRNAAERTQSSRNVPTDVREAMLTPEGRRTAKQINRLARWSGSTQGQEMGGVAGLEQSLQPVDAQKQQYDEMRLYKLGLEIEKMQKEKPTEYQKAAAAVDEAIAAGNIEVQDRNKFILRDLGWQAREGEYSQDFVNYINNLKPSDGAESGGKSNIPQAAIDALISDPSKASEFDKYFGPGSSAKFL
jgi:hypothetical protein